MSHSPRPNAATPASPPAAVAATSAMTTPIRSSASASANTPSNNNSLATPTHPYQTRSRSRSPSPLPSAASSLSPPSPNASPSSPSASLMKQLSSLSISPGPKQDLSAGIKHPVSQQVFHPAARSTTGLVYDPRCLLHQANYGHVERPQRVSESIKLLLDQGLYSRCVHIPTRPALDSEIIGRAHSAEHVAAIDQTARDSYGPDELDSETEGDTTYYPDCKFLDSDTYVNRFSSDAARYSIGGLINLLEEVVEGRLKNGFAVIRPPGHHADVVKASGFCLYNNVAVAVQAIQAKHPKVKKVLIVDWDVHHGNGTQNIFYNDPSVLYFSVHRHQGGAFYPHTGAAEEVGGDKAQGTNVNVPLNFTKLGDAEYIEIFQTLLIPIVREWAPDLIIISAGFDCAQGDPLGGMEVTSEGFAHLTSLLLRAMPHGRVVMALEGGYNVRAVSEAVSACVHILLNDPLPALEDPFVLMGKREINKIMQKRELFRQDLGNCIKIQRKYFKCLQSIVLKEEQKVDDKPAAAAAPGSSSTPVTTSSTTVTHTTNAAAMNSASSSTAVSAPAAGTAAHNISVSPPLKVTSPSQPK